MRKMVFAGLAVAGFAQLANDAQARPFCTNPPFIHLLPLTGTRGSAVVEISNNVEPGDLACFKLDVPAARTLHVTLASRGHNGFFRLYPPGWTITRDGRAFNFGEAALPGAADGDYAHSWTGPLAQLGSTLIVIGMKQGGGQYRIHVEAS